MLKFTAALLIKIGLEHLFHRRIHLSHVPNAEAAFIGFCKNKKLAEGGSLCGFSIGSLAQDRLLTWAAEFCRQNRYGGFVYAGGDLRFFDRDYDVLKAEAARDRSKYHRADGRPGDEETDHTLFLVVPPGAAPQLPAPLVPAPAPGAPPPENV